MPHKHTRKRDDDDRHFDLAPNRIAKPLPSFEATPKNEKKGKGKQKGKKKEQEQSNLKRKRGFTAQFKEDDTPRAFARLMQLQAGQKPRSGLDDGENKKSRKKRKVEQLAKEDTQPSPKTTAIDPRTGEELKILPGERMSDFAARVNQALPVSGLSRKAKSADGQKERQTKTEKRLHKMYAEWREEEARRKEKLEELQEQQEEQDEEKTAEYGGQDIHLPSSSRQSKKKRMVGEIDDDDDDPWAVLKTKREAPKGLHDVVQAPPTMNVVPKEKFKVRNGAKVSVANVPGASGMKSLKQREELSEARKDVIERYRAMMKGGGRL
ncbi:hypothetical protein M409DRAFT_67437 [Zasmidium cellare ATCC 36951]|uniref:Urease accessory protein UreD n=1 Tax=Zasmidium cellare ATCC 36951 TaxID=1080233 RepID=A0A6A6CDJ6_ZASCE|nr:uncharacterized protein M409DRAFT_67437 [Zasmidium cellare ATCC 36951]KAF2165165.1 hypothetical protein M409DRAFT_67437 [Zasmidium cellare ATCC 36951]